MRRLLHYRLILLYYRVVITLPGDYYIFGCNTRPAGRAGQLLRRSLPWASDWSTTTSSDRSTHVPSNPVYNQRPGKIVLLYFMYVLDSCYT